MARRINIYLEADWSGRTGKIMTPDRFTEALRDLTNDVHVSVATTEAPDTAALQKADVFVGTRFDPALLKEHGRLLRLIHCTAAGVERLMPLDWLPPGATLTNSSGAHAGKAGEFGLMALMMLNDRMPRYATKQREHVWAPLYSTPIRGKTALIYGVGALGGDVAERAKAIGVKVWGIRNSGAPHPAVDRMFGPEALDDLLPRIDFIVITCPLTSQTRNLFNRERLSLLPAHAGLVNMSRSAVVDYDALVHALRGNALSGAILDVFDKEPLPPDAIYWDAPNLIVVPHVSSDSGDGYINRTFDICIDNIRRLLLGTPLANIVAVEHGY